MQITTPIVKNRKKTQAMTSSSVSGDVIPSIIPLENKSAELTNYQIFPKKTLALEYLANKKDPLLYLYCEDTSIKATKRFITTTHDILYEKVSEKELHMYESFEAGEQVKLFIDIDLKGKQLPKEKDQWNDKFNSVVYTTIQLVNKQLEQYDIPLKQIIVLCASTHEKISAHIIYRNVVFNNITDMKFFMHNIRSPLVDDNIIDLSVYKVGCLRMLHCSKMGKNNPFKLNNCIDYKATNPKELFLSSLVRHIETNSSTINFKAPDNIKLKPKKKSKQINKIIVDPKDPDAKIVTTKVQSDIPLEILHRYLSMINIKRADLYGLWIEIGMILHNCNQKSFKMWDTWSQKSEKYDCELMSKYKWQSFTYGGVGFPTLLMHAKKDNPELYDKMEFNVEGPKFESIKFESKYLFDCEDEKIKARESFLAKHIDDWICSAIKVLSIKSPYNTGKTQMITKILHEYDPEKVLFISYRQTLTNDLFGNFKQFGVASYMDKFFGAPRIICQLESLPKLLSECLFNDQIEIPSYDLVILDEIESIMSHLRSSTLKEKEWTFNLLMDIIHNSKKILSLDGDFHNRGYEFVKSCGSHVVLENTVQKGDKHFIFTHDLKTINDKIDADIKAGLNVAIVSMSSTIASEFYDRYKDTNKCVLHCSSSDDSLKNDLKDVNNFWINYQLLCYSPSVEAGVNFDTKHFNKMYCILSKQSCSPRAFLQMTARIRQLEDKTIYVYNNGFPFKTKASYYKFDEVKAHVLDVYNKYLTPVSVLDEETNKKVIRFKYDLYTKILIHNETENKNKQAHYFVPYLLQLLTNKGNTYEHYVNPNQQLPNKEISKVEIMKEELLQAENLTDEQYKILINKQKQNLATHIEKIQIEKHLYKTNWKITEITAEFLDKYYRKTYVLNNLKSYLDPDKIVPYISVNGSDKYIVNFDKGKKLEQIRIIKEVIELLGYKNIADNIKLDRETFVKNIEIVKTKSKLIADPSRSQPLFGFNKTKICSVKSFLGFINSVLNEYGLTIKVSRKTVRIGTKIITKLSYFLSYYKTYNSYL